jgi:hypothetical protein
MRLIYLNTKTTTKTGTYRYLFIILLSAGEPSVGVQPGAEQVHADVTNPHDDEPERADFRAFVFGFFGDQARVQIGGVGEPGD